MAIDETTAPPPTQASDAADVVNETMPSPRALRFGSSGRSIRVMAARGTIVNGVFLVFLNLLSMLKGFIVVLFVSASQYGIWGVIGATFGSLGPLKQAGIGDKYVQQDEIEQEEAFQKAFTLEFIVTTAFLTLVSLLIVPIALAYDRSEIIAPAFVLGASIPAAAFQVPLWIFLRRMQFVKQRRLQAVSPIVSFVVTIALAAAGAGYWALVIGVVVGAWAGAFASVLACPYRLRFRFDRATARSYFSFSWPVFLSGIATLVLIQVPVLFASHELGLAAVGAIALGNLIPTYARQASDVVTQTIYPAVCAVKDRPDLMLESFSKTNRVGMIWGVPFGIGVALFAGDLVDFVLGSEWDHAVVLLQFLGLATAVNQFGYNWTAFYRARADTRPMAIAAAIQMIAVCGFTVPLMIVDGLTGFGIGMFAAAGVYAITRTYYLRRLFGEFSLVRHAVRGTASVVPAVVLILVFRAVAGIDRTPTLAMTELVVFAIVTAGATLLLERALLREMLDYIRKRSARLAPA